MRHTRARAAEGWAVRRLVRNASRIVRRPVPRTRSAGWSHCARRGVVSARCRHRSRGMVVGGGTSIALAPRGLLRRSPMIRTRPVAVATRLLPGPRTNRSTVVVDVLFFFSLTRGNDFEKERKKEKKKHRPTDFSLSRARETDDGLITTCNDATHGGTITDTHGPRERARTAINEKHSKLRSPSHERVSRVVHPAYAAFNPVGRSARRSVGSGQIDGDPRGGGGGDLCPRWRV